MFSSAFVPACGKMLVPTSEEISSNIFEEIPGVNLVQSVAKFHEKFPFDLLYKFVKKEIIFGAVCDRFLDQC